MKDKDSKPTKKHKIALFFGILFLTCLGQFAGYVESLDLLHHIDKNELIAAILSRSIFLLAANFIIYLVLGLSFERFVSLWLVLSLSHLFSFTYFCLVAGKIDSYSILKIASPYLVLLFFYREVLE
jgi:hypothetical protein